MKKYLFFMVILITISACRSDSSENGHEGTEPDEPVVIEKDGTKSDEGFPLDKPEKPDASPSHSGGKSGKTTPGYSGKKGTIISEEKEEEKDEEDGATKSGDSMTEKDGPSSTTDSGLEEPIEDSPTIPKVALLDLSPADRDALVNSFDLAPGVAYQNKRVQFIVKARGRSKWQWDFDLDGDGSWDGGKETPNATTYTILGLKKIKVRAKSKNYTQTFEREIEVTISKDVVSKLFADIKSFAKAGDEDKAALKLKELNAILHPNFAIRIPDPAKSLIKDFRDFEDIVYADLPEVEVYTHLTEVKSDRETGLIKSVTLK